MPWQISIDFQGDEFQPSRVPFAFTEQYDPGAIGSLGCYRGQPEPYGWATYIVPSSIPRAESISHLVHTIEPILPAIRAAGATDWTVNIARYYHAQCNEEYSLEELQLIVRLGCGFTYSAYSLTEDGDQKLA